METIFLVLSGVVLAAGVLYWFWSHIQLTQKKVQLLENAVFELRGLVSGSRDPASDPPDTGSSKAPAPSPVYQDLADDEEEDWVPAAAPSASSVEIGSTPLSSLQAESSDLQPGGRLEVPALSPSADERVVTTDEKFRELFVQREPRVPTPPPATATAAAAATATATAAATESTEKPLTSESLESMPVKDLRRLAEQRGITGVSDMRKKEILSALRQQVTLPSATSEGTVVVERTLDLTETVESVVDDGLQEATVLE